MGDVEEGYRRFEVTHSDGEGETSNKSIGVSREE
jgi:hypothetical protein